MKRCELCTNVARMYCNSDNASLCYDCDQTVHSANFLVAKHSRTLLCHKCQSPTPWTASGLDLGRTASVCVNCLEEESSRRRRRSSIDGGRSNRNDVVEEDCDLRDDDDDLGHGGDRIGETEEEEDSDSERSDESEDLDLDEDAENQVVPWSIMASSPPTTTAGCCSSSEELSSSRFSSDDSRSGSKRERLDDYIDSEDDAVCSLERSKSRAKIDVAISLRSFTPF